MKKTGQRLLEGFLKRELSEYEYTRYRLGAYDHLWEVLSLSNLKENNRDGRR